MLDPAINNVGFPHAPLERLDATLHLRDHPFCYHSFLNELAGLIDLKRAQKPSLFVLNPIHVGEENKLFRA